MADHMTQPLDELANDILSDGVVDADEVKKIRERVFADKVVDREEADFLFKINDGVSGKDNDPGWKDLMVEAISAHVLHDETTPNEVDDDEAAWLISKIEGDEQVDDIEKAILSEIKAKATSLADALKSKMDAWGV